MTEQNLLSKEYQLLVEECEHKSKLITELMNERDSLTILLNEAHNHHTAVIKKFYDIFGVDGSDGEIRAKWALMAARLCKDGRDELAAMVEVLRAEMEFSATKIVERSPSDEVYALACSIMDAARATPQQCLRDALAADNKALANAVLNALYGTLLDEHGNRDENGLLAWGKAEDARNALIEVAALARKVGV